MGQAPVWQSCCGTKDKAATGFFPTHALRNDPTETGFLQLPPLPSCCLDAYTPYSMHLWGRSGGQWLGIPYQPFQDTRELLRCAEPLWAARTRQGHIHLGHILLPLKFNVPLLHRGLLRFNVSCATALPCDLGLLTPPAVPHFPSPKMGLKTSPGV